MNWQDADLYARDYDGDGTDNPDPIPYPVIVDYNWEIYLAYRYPCETQACKDSCWVTPQHQLLDQGLVTVEDTCSVPDGETTCTQCGWGSVEEADLRAILDNILPPVWCGEGIP